ncbi:hypothetical protein SCHPADRAFT_886914 [Schizopora paradoxa]|uniref:Uncharacterized protein n=1 Tax=Schizopora paradoxa TaxID=27342 RepID=A0A0H2RZT3_9AGAM|nr:hypothetical protein SCHPADRAFT_886914 [Schizopora paradoxa]
MTTNDNGKVELWAQIDKPIPEYLIPPFLTPTIANQTRDISNNELMMDAQEVLHAVVYAPKMLEGILRLYEKQAKEVDIYSKKAEDLNSDAYWFAHVAPELSSASLPAILKTEMDTTAWFSNVLARPALAAVQAVQAKGTEPLMKTIKPALSRDDINNYSSIVYITSAPGIKGYPIPDLLFGMMRNPRLRDKQAVVYKESTLASFNVRLGDKKDPAKTSQEKVYDECFSTIELKTSNALTKDTFNLVLRNFREDDTSTTVIPVPFFWPQRKNSKDPNADKRDSSNIPAEKDTPQASAEPSDTNTKVTKMLIQIEEKNNPTKIKHVNVMFLSPAYFVGGSDQDNLNHMSISKLYAWLMHCTKETSNEKDLILPDIDLQILKDIYAKDQVRLDKILNTVLDEKTRKKPGLVYSIADKYTDANWRQTLILESDEGTTGKSSGSGTAAPDPDTEKKKPEGSRPTRSSRK